MKFQVSSSPMTYNQGDYKNSTVKYSHFEKKIF